MGMLGLDMAMRGAFFVLLGIFTIYTLFLAYHWFTYTASARVATVALSSYLVGGAFLLIIMAALII